MCGYGFEAGKTYLVSAILDEESSRWEVHFCGETRPIESATAQLRSWRAWQAGVELPTRVHGTVKDSTQIREMAPLPGVRVKLSNGWNSYEVITDGDGLFVIDDLSPGDNVGLW